MMNEQTDAVPSAGDVASKLTDENLCRNDDSIEFIKAGGTAMVHHPSETCPAETCSVEAASKIFNCNDCTVKSLFDILDNNSITIRGLSGPVIDEVQRKDLHDWTEKLLVIAHSSTSVKPSSRLAALLEGGTSQNDLNAVLIPILRYSVISVATDCVADIYHKDLSDLYSISANMEYRVHQMAHPLPGAVLYLHYFALECIIESDIASRQESIPNGIVFNAQFHRSLFTLCHFCLSKARDHWKHSFIIQATGSCPVVYYKLVESFIQALHSSYASTLNKNLTLPSYLTQVLRQIQELLLDSLWLIQTDHDNDNIDFGSIFIQMINKLRERPSTWPLTFLLHMCKVRSGVPTPTYSSDTRCEEYNSVQYMMHKLLNVIDRRVRTMCNLLLLPNSSAVVDKAMMVFIMMICYRIDIFFGRHPDQIMLCTLYAVCAKMKFVPGLKFADIKNAYEEMNVLSLSRNVVHDILFRIKNCSDDNETGDILMFYNNIFVPSMKGLWGLLISNDFPDVTSELPTELCGVLHP